MFEKNHSVYVEQTWGTEKVKASKIGFEASVIVQVREEGRWIKTI